MVAALFLSSRMCRPFKYAAYASQLVCTGCDGGPRRCPTRTSIRDAIACATSTSSAMTSSRLRSKLSDQMCIWSATRMSWAVMRTRDADSRTLPSST